MCPIRPIKGHSINFLPGYRIKVLELELHSRVVILFYRPKVLYDTSSKTAIPFEPVQVFS